MILYIENPRHHQKSLRTNYFSKVAGYESKYKNSLYFYTLITMYLKKKGIYPIFISTFL